MKDTNILDRRVAALAKVRRDCVPRVANEQHRRTNQLRAPDRAAPAVQLGAGALLCDDWEPLLRTSCRRHQVACTHTR